MLQPNMTATTSGELASISNPCDRIDGIRVAASMYVVEQSQAWQIGRALFATMGKLSVDTLVNLHAASRRLVRSSVAAEVLAIGLPCYS